MVHTVPPVLPVVALPPVVLLGPPLAVVPLVVLPTELAVPSEPGPVAPMVPIEPVEAFPLFVAGGASVPEQLRPAMHKAKVELFAEAVRIRIVLRSVFPTE